MNHPALFILAVWGLAPQLQLAAHEGIHDSLIHNEQAILEEPDSSSLHLERAKLLIDHGEPEEAISVLHVAASHGALPDACAMLRAKALMQLKRALEAATELEPVILAHPKHLPALSLRARALAAGGKSELALADCRKSLELQKDPDMAFLAVDLLIVRGDVPAAIILLDGCFPAPAQPASVFNRALDLELACGRWDAALARLDQKIASARRPEPVMARKAEVLEAAGRHDDAVSAWKVLAARLAGLPPSARNSHAMSLLAEKARNSISTPDPTLP